MKFIITNVDNDQSINGTYYETNHEAIDDLFLINLNRIPAIKRADINAIPQFKIRMVSDDKVVGLKPYVPPELDEEIYHPFFVGFDRRKKRDSE